MFCDVIQLLPANGPLGAAMEQQQEQTKGQHQHDVSRHGQNIRSFTLILDQPIKIDTFATALEALLLTQGSRLLRLKGIVNTVDRPGKPMVIHGVQHVELLNHQDNSHCSNCDNCVLRFAPLFCNF